MRENLSFTVLELPDVLFWHFIEETRSVADGDQIVSKFSSKQTQFLCSIFVKNEVLAL